MQAATIELQNTPIIWNEHNSKVKNQIAITVNITQ